VSCNRCSITIKETGDDTPHPALSPKGRGENNRRSLFPLPSGGED
jgi:hypothetical protein